MNLLSACRWTLLAVALLVMAMHPIWAYPLDGRDELDVTNENGRNLTGFKTSPESTPFGEFELASPRNGTFSADDSIDANSVIHFFMAVIFTYSFVTILNMVPVLFVVIFVKYYSNKADDV